MPRVTNKPPEPELTSEYLLTVKLVSEFRQAWIDQFKAAGVSQVLFSRLSLVAMTQVAAITGVDIGMNEQQFLAVCRANFQQAYANAPKFG